MRYEITGGNFTSRYLLFTVGEGMITESGSMSWMSEYENGDLIGGGMKKMLGRAFSGENAFQNRYSAQGGDGMIAFASSFPGSVNALEIGPGKSMIVQKKAFLAAEEGVELSVYMQKKLGKGLFGGEGFIMQKLTGQGTAFIEIDGYGVEYNLAQDRK